MRHSIALLIVWFVAVMWLCSDSKAQQFTPVRNVLQKCFGPNCQQNAAATDFGYDTDGAKIVSVGPVMDPVPSLAPALPPVASSQAIGAPIEMSRMDFRQAVLKAARQERGVSLGFADYWAVFRGSLKPQLVEEARQCVFDSGVQDGVIPVSQSIDAINWEKLIELIIKYLPQIIDIFTGK